MFINYDVNRGIQINTFRAANAVCGDIGDLVIDGVIGGQCVCCDLEGAKAELEDGGYWQGSNATAEALEEVHAAVCRHEEGEH